MGCLPDPNFIAPPTRDHLIRGVAVDLTLTDNQGNELDMGTDFDEFSRLSYHGCLDISSESYKQTIIVGYHDRCRMGFLEMNGGIISCSIQKSPYYL